MGEDSSPFFCKRLTFRSKSKVKRLDGREGTVNPHTFEGSNSSAKRSGNWNSPRKYEGFSISVE
jgi:hypothetical protein